MRTLAIIILSTLSFTCKKHETASHYPDCFKDLTASPYKVNGCGTVVTTVELDKYKLVSITLLDDSLHLKTACQSFDIAIYSNSIKIKYHTYGHASDSTYFIYCNDAIPRIFGASTTWNAVSGTVAAVVSVEKANRNKCDTFLTSIKLENVRFVKDNSTLDTIITSLIIKDRKVGNCIP